MNFNPYIYHLGQYAARDQWQNTTRELCLEVMAKILDTTPTKESWLALQELLGAWPETDDVMQWVADLEPGIRHWPWRMRHSILGQQHTREGRECVYRLVGYLHIENIEDGGPKLRKWCQDENWQNLKGISLYKVEAEAEDLAKFLQSPYLKQLELLELRVLDSLSRKLGILFGRAQLLRLSELRLLSLNLISIDLATLKQASISQQLISLNISGNFIHDHDLPLLLDSASFASMQRLDLGFTSISATALEEAIVNLNHPALKLLEFEGTAAASKLKRDSIEFFQNHQ